MSKWVYVHIYEELFSKTYSPNLALPLQPRFGDWRLTRFGKELFKYAVLLQRRIP